MHWIIPVVQREKAVSVQVLPVSGGSQMSQPESVPLRHAGRLMGWHGSTGSPVSYILPGQSKREEAETRAASEQ